MQNALTARAQAHRNIEHGESAKKQQKKEQERKKKRTEIVVYNSVGLCQILYTTIYGRYIEMKYELCFAWLSSNEFLLFFFCGCSPFVM